MHNKGASETLPRWDLKAIFKSPSDPAIEQCFKDAEKLNSQLVKARGHLARSVAFLVKQLSLYERLSILLDLPVEYAGLRFADDSSSSDRGAFLSKCQERSLSISRKSLWFELELGKLSGATVKKLEKDKDGARFAHFVRRAIQYSKHRLSAREEELISTLDLSGRQAFSRLFDEERVEQVYTLAGKKCSETDLLGMLYHRNRSKRKAAADALTIGLRSGLRRSAYITNVLALNKAQDDKERGFETPESSRHLANDTTAQMVEAMLAAVEDNSQVVSKYYKIKRKLLGLNELYDYDRYAPVSLAADIKLTYNKAKEIVLESFARFSPQYGDLARQFFTKNWIDVAPRPGKRSGAFCSFGTPSTHPVVFLNYQGTARDLFTLAHELGHAIHGCLMQEVGYLNYRVPLTIAETASVFSEMLVFDHLYKSLDSKEQKLALLMGRVENCFATVFRQVSMYRFEQNVHSERRAKGELSPARISQIWRACQSKVYGNSVILRPEYDCWWSYIPHFVHTPFYVYAYAYGELLSLALYAEYRQSGAKLVDAYIEILSKGSSASPEDLVSSLKIKLNTSAFWRKGVSVISDLVDQCHALTK